MGTRCCAVAWFLGSFFSSLWHVDNHYSICVWTVEAVIHSCDDLPPKKRFPCLTRGCLTNADLCNQMQTFVCFPGRSINMKSAGIIGRNGPQSKQPFLVAFFKASEVLLRSVRATGSKRKSHNRNKSKTQAKSTPALKSGGTVEL